VKPGQNRAAEHAGHEAGVHSSVEAGVLRVSIDRPGSRNALALAVLDSLRLTFLEHSKDDRLRLAVLTGSGDRAFASGGDLKELSSWRSEGQAGQLSLRGKAALHAIRSFPVPVVGRINGVALGGGAELALSCDLRFACQSARIGFIHGRLNIAPSWGGSTDLVRLVGPAKSLLYLSEQRIFDATAAVAAGLFDDVCPEGEIFDNWFEQRLDVLAKNPPQVMRAFKALTGRTANRSDSDEIETRHFKEVWAHSDHWEAVDRMDKGKQ
jgi:enoyl-CoA hydratase